MQQLFNYFTNNNIIESARKELKIFNLALIPLKVKQDCYGASNIVQKILNLTPIPTIGSTSKVNHSYTNKINLTFRFENRLRIRAVQVSDL